MPLEDVEVKRINMTFEKELFDHTKDAIYHYHLDSLTAYIRMLVRRDTANLIKSKEIPKTPHHLQ